MSRKENGEISYSGGRTALIRIYRLRVVSVISARVTGSKLSCLADILILRAEGPMFQLSCTGYGVRTLAPLLIPPDK